MPGKGINGRANMQKFQGNSKKYGGNPFKFASLVSSTGRVGRGGMWNYIQRRADHYDTAKKTTIKIQGVFCVNAPPYFIIP